MRDRTNRMLRAGGGISLVLLIVAGFYLFRGLAVYHTQTHLLDRHYLRLAGLNTRTPFPSPDNIALEQLNLELVEGLASALADELMQVSDERVARDAADFSARAQEMIELFRKRAGAASVILSENLEAGFSEYASGGAVPDADQVPRLSRQLFSVEKIADILVHCGVHSIEALTRDQFEKKPVEPSRDYGRRPARETSSGGGRSAVPSGVNPVGLYTSERIGVVFTAKESVIWAVLEQLAETPRIMAVRDFSHETQTGILSYQPDDPKELDMKTPEAEGFITKKLPQSRAVRMLTGNERIRVSLEIDVYDFYAIATRSSP